MANKDYIERLIQVICHLHKTDATHTGSVPVTEVFQGQTLWDGVVEVFSLKSHPKASRAYAWSYPDENGAEKFVTVLEMPPVQSPADAVKVAVVAAVKGKK